MKLCIEKKLTRRSRAPSCMYDFIYKIFCWFYCRSKKHSFDEIERSFRTIESFLYNE